MLSDRHNPDLGCFPSITRMTKDCNMSRSSIFNHLQQLEDKGLISRKGRIRPDGQQTSNEYYLHIAETVQNLDEGGTDIGRGVVQNLDTNNHVSINHVIKSNKINYEFESFWKIYPRKIGKGLARKAYEKALKKNGVEKINSAAVVFAENSKSKDPKFIPHPSTWLNQERWDDVIDAPKDIGIDQMFREMVSDLARVNR